MALPKFDDIFSSEPKLIRNRFAIAKITSPPELYFSINFTIQKIYYVGTSEKVISMNYAYPSFLRWSYLGRRCIYSISWCKRSILSFLNFYLAAPQSTLGHYWEDSLIHSMLNNVFYNFDTKSLGAHWIPSPTEPLAGFEPGTLQFWMESLNPLSQSSLCRHFLNFVDG